MEENDVREFHARLRTDAWANMLANHWLGAWCDGYAAALRAAGLPVPDREDLERSGWERMLVVATAGRLLASQVAGSD